MGIDCGAAEKKRVLQEAIASGKVVVRVEHFRYDPVMTLVAKAMRFLDTITMRMDPENPHPATLATYRRKVGIRAMRLRAFWDADVGDDAVISYKGMVFRRYNRRRSDWNPHSRGGCTHVILHLRKAPEDKVTADDVVVVGYSRCSMDDTFCYSKGVGEALGDAFDTLRAMWQTGEDRQVMSSERPLRLQPAVFTAV